MAKKLNKRNLLKKFLEIPRSASRDFYCREMKMLNSLIDRYSEEFVCKLNFAKKFDSMAVIICDAFKTELDRKFRNFNYEIDFSKYETFKVDAIKHGSDLTIKRKIKTIRDFLNG
jgi:hypothetical protein